jgi:hypothetical protein
MIYIIIIQGIIFGAFSAYIAGEKNKNPLSWFILGFLFSILAILALAATPKKETEDASQAAENKPFDDGNNKYANHVGDIDDKSYQLYLVSKFGITRNEVLNVYGLNGVAYEKIDEPLLIAHQQHKAKISERSQVDIATTSRVEDIFGHSCTIYPDGSASIATATGKIHTFKTKDEAELFARKKSTISS